MNTSLKVILRLFMTSLLPLVPVAVMVATTTYLADPMQFYRTRSDGYVAEANWRASGIIRKHFINEGNGNTAILGASIGVNILPDDVEGILGRPGAYNIADHLTGPEEIRSQLSLLMKSESLKTVICVLEKQFYFRSDTHISHGKEYMPTVYDASFIGAARYLLDKRMYFLSLKALTFGFQSLSTDSVPNPVSQFYMRNACRNGKFSAFSDPRQMESHRALRERARKNVARSRQLLSTTGGQLVPASFRNIDLLIKIIIENPRIEFILYVPPFMAGATTNYGVLPEYYHTLGMRHLATRLAAVRNAKIYAFDDVPEITENVANFLDQWHPALGVPRYFLHAAREGEHEIDIDNCDAYLDRVLRIWEEGSVYRDVENTIGFEGPLDERAYGEIPYPKSKYTLPKTPGK